MYKKHIKKNAKTDERMYGRPSKKRTICWPRSIKWSQISSGSICYPNISVSNYIVSYVCS